MQINLHVNNVNSKYIAAVLMLKKLRHQLFSRSFGCCPPSFPVALKANYSQFKETKKNLSVSLKLVHFSKNNWDLWNNFLIIRCNKKSPQLKSLSVVIYPLLQSFIDTQTIIPISEISIMHTSLVDILTLRKLAERFPPINFIRYKIPILVLTDFSKPS